MILPNTSEKVLNRVNPLITKVKREFTREGKDLEFNSVLPLRRYIKEGILSISLDRAEYMIYMGLISQIAWYVEDVQSEEDEVVRIMEFILRAESSVNAFQSKADSNPISTLIICYTMVQSAITAGEELKKLL